jgi:hypothetical protein
MTNSSPPGKLLQLRVSDRARTGVGVRDRYLEIHTSHRALPATAPVFTFTVLVFIMEELRIK